MTLMDSHMQVGPSQVATRAVWHEVEDGFWVGNTEGQFLGTIERQGDDRYFCRNSVRAYVGEYHTLDAARQAIVTSV